MTPDQDIWQPVENGKTVGQIGSEGTIIADQEHADGARITLERDSVTAPFAITCGLAGWMVHTRFFRTEHAAWEAYADMKEALSNLLTLVPDKSDMEDQAKLSSFAKALEEYMTLYP